MIKSIHKTLDSEKLHDDLFVYLVQQGRKKFVVLRMDENTTHTVSSHTRLERAEASFDSEIDKLRRC